MLVLKNFSLQYLVLNYLVRSDVVLPTILGVVYLVDLSENRTAIKVEDFAEHV